MARGSRARCMRRRPRVDHRLCDLVCAWGRCAGDAAHDGEAEGRGPDRGAVEGGVRAQRARLRGTGATKRCGEQIGAFESGVRGLEKEMTDLSRAEAEAAGACCCMLLLLLLQMLVVDVLLLLPMMRFMMMRPGRGRRGALDNAARDRVGVA